MTTIGLSASIESSIAQLAQLYADHRRLALSTVGRLAMGHGHFFIRLAAGRVTIRRANDALQWFSDQWPRRSPLAPGRSSPRVPRVGGVRALAVADISGGRGPYRLRTTLDQDWVAVLADSMGEVGQLTTIDVELGANGALRLVAGAHRLAAAQRLGWVTISALVHAEGDTPDAARLREIDENLVRRELSALDRALHLAERKKVYERLYPEARHGGHAPSESEPGKSSENQWVTEASPQVADFTSETTKCRL